MGIVTRIGIRITKRMTNKDHSNDQDQSKDEESRLRIRMMVMRLGARLVVVEIAAKKELITGNASQTSYLM